MNKAVKNKKSETGPFKVEKIYESNLKKIYKMLNDQ